MASGGRIEGDDAFCFEGNDALIGLVRRLYPRHGRRDRNTRPLVCLIRQEKAEPVLPLLQVKFGPPGAVVHLHQRSDADHPPPEHGQRPPITEQDVTLVLVLLRELTTLLGRVADRRRRVRRFRRFALTVWLMSQQLGESAGDQESRERRVRELLRNHVSDHQTQIPNDLPGWLGALAIVLPFVWFRARVSGRLPVLSGHYRWFIRRESLAPPVSGGVTDVAAALTDGEWQRDPHTTLLFLVNSFIEDIRAAFHGRQHTACAVLLLGNITRRNGGYQLLRAINDVRNLTELPDPLLVVSESLRVPPFAEEPRGVPPTAQAEQAYAAWRARHENPRHSREAPAWYLPLTLPAVAAQPEAREPYRVAYREAAPLVAPPEPRYRQSVRAGAAVLVLVCAAFGYHHWSLRHCGTGISWPGLHPTVWLAGGAAGSGAGAECVGVTDGTTGVFPDLADQLNVIAAQNAQALEQHADQPARPLLTLVYLGVLTAPNNDVQSLATEREGLKGAAVAQRWQLDAHGTTDPLVRILVANGGQRMSSGPSVADTIIRMIHDDPSIVGVIGLSQSYQSTVDTIDRLAGAGVPSIGATLSTDVLADSSPLYYQIAPQNKREAAVVVDYVAHLRQTGALPAVLPVRIYYSADPNDRYSANLDADLTASFDRAGMRPDSVPYTAPGQPGDASAAGRDACGFPGLVLYAGRPQPDFGSFLNSIRNCGNQPPPRRIIADDDTTRYVADQDARRRYGSVGFDYVSFAATPPLAAGTERDFYTEYGRLFSGGGQNPEASGSLDGHAALSFDTVLTFVYAVSYLHGAGESIPVSPAAVWRQISSVSGSTGFAGASGYIDFGADVNRHVPIDKPVLVLGVRNGEVVNDASGYCGVRRDPRTQPWCPHDLPR